MLAWFFALLSTCFGLALIVVSQQKGNLCKLRDVDFSTWRVPDKPGHIPVVSASGSQYQKVISVEVHFSVDASSRMSFTIWELFLHRFASPSTIMSNLGTFAHRLLWQLLLGPDLVVCHRCQLLLSPLAPFGSQRANERELPRAW